MIGFFSKYSFNQSMSYLTDKILILDSHGTVIGSKDRKDIDRKKDVLYSVHVLVFTSDNRFALSTIPAITPLPKLFNGKYGSTVATLVRMGEDAKQAAIRAMKEEILYEGARPIFLGEKLDAFGENIQRLHATFFLKYQEEKISFNPDKIEGMSYYSRPELEALIATEKETFAPTFLLIYQRYNDKWPF